MAVPTAIARAGKSQSICETELQREFPLHVVCSWLGSSPRIAQQSYLLETEDDFDGAEGEKKVMVGGRVDSCCGDGARRRASLPDLSRTSDSIPNRDFYDLMLRSQ